MAGGIININTNIKKKNASVVSTLNFEDTKTKEAKNNLVPTPKRGHNTSGLKKTVYKSTILGQAIGKFLKKYVYDLFIYQIQNFAFFTKCIIWIRSFCKDIRISKCRIIDFINLNNLW